MVRSPSLIAPGITASALVNTSHVLPVVELPGVVVHVALNENGRSTVVPRSFRDGPWSRSVIRSVSLPSSSPA